MIQMPNFEDACKEIYAIGVNPGLTEQDRKDLIRMAVFEFGMSLIEDSDCRKEITDFAGILPDQVVLNEITLELPRPERNNEKALRSRT